MVILKMTISRQTEGDPGNPGHHLQAVGQMREGDWSNQRYKRGNFGENFVTCCDHVNAVKMYSWTCLCITVGKIREKSTSAVILLYHSDHYCGNFHTSERNES